MVLSLSGLMTIRNILAYSSIVKKNPDNNSCTTANSFALVDLVQSTSKILPFSIANSVWSGQGDVSINYARFDAHQQIYFQSTTTNVVQKICVFDYRMKILAVLHQHIFMKSKSTIQTFICVQK